MNIPARYCTGYLGDIGMPPPYAAGDFAGWFEAYIGGRWYTFDARNNIPRIGRVLIAQGRDAADVPITQTFGPNTLVSFKVWTDEVVEASDGARQSDRSARPIMREAASRSPPNRSGVGMANTAIIRDAYGSPATFVGSKTGRDD